MTTNFAAMSAAQLHAYLVSAEVDGGRAPDCRRVLRDERFALAAAMRRGDSTEISAARREAARVAAMWDGL